MNTGGGGGGGGYNWCASYPPHTPHTPHPSVQLTALRRLELQYSGFADGPPAVVGELCGLEELNLSGNLWGSTVRDLPAEYSQLT